MNRYSSALAIWRQFQVKRYSQSYTVAIRDVGSITRGLSRNYTFHYQLFSHFQYLTTDRQQRQAREQFQTTIGELSVTSSRFGKHELGHEQIEVRAAGVPPVARDLLVSRHQ